MRTKTCPRCGVTFSPKDWRNTYCSRRCSKLKDLPTKACERCGVTFTKSNEISYAVWDAARYCSRKCGGNGKPKRFATCPICSTRFQVLSGRTTFCSQECTGISRRTVNFPDKRRGACFTHSMRRALFARDGEQCAQCGATENLECDHVVPIHLGGSNTIENGQVLCRPCHRAKTNAELRAAWAA